MNLLIISYLRTENTIKLIESAFSYGIKKIYLAIDGPKNSEENNIQELLISYINSVQSQNKFIAVWRRERNLGIAVSVITAIDWFFKYEESGIIVEDDLQITRSFIDFSQRNLDTYRTNNKVLMISGNYFGPPPSGYTNLFCNYPQIWGWSTWQHKWNQMRNMLIANHKMRLKHIFSAPRSFFHVGAKRVMKSMIDTWDLPLAYEFLKGDYLCVLPPVNLVTNIGVDAHSIHTKNKEFPLNYPVGNLDLNKLASPVISQDSIQKENSFLEKHVFRIRFHHHFLAFYAPLLNIVKSYKLRKKKTQLISRLDEVTIP